ncbi:MAG: ATP-binding cassette domain-containing protein [Acidobacteriota bacterium]
MSAPVLRVRNLRKTHSDGTEALRGIDLELGGGMYGLLGPNGAGKTTLLSILVLALEPTAGELLYRSPDRDLDASRLADRSTIRALLGYLPQDFRPLALLSGREYLEHCASLRQPSEPRSARRARASDLLRSVGLEGAAERPAGKYSGGMMRRLGLAQALIHRPRLLIVDEPTAGLDPEERMRFRNLVAEVAEHTSVILSTHIVEDVEATCPRLGVLWNGRLHFDGSPADLLRRATGKLWRLPEQAPLPPGAETLGMRAAVLGHERLVRAEQAPERGTAHTPHLEDAYAALLSELGGAAAIHSILEATSDASVASSSA